ncbi:hypothetical protein ACUHGC_10395 [Testudinibacter sp. P27/CKL/0425]
MSEKIGDIHIDISMETAELLKSASSADFALEKLEKSLESAAKTVEKFDAKLNKMAKTVNENTTTAGKSKRAFEELAGAMLKGGQNTESYISSLSSLGYLFGGLAGVVATAAGVLLADFISSLSNSKTEIERLKQAMSQLDNVIKFSQNGVAALSNEYAILIKSNADLAQSIKNATLAEYKLQIKNSTAAVKELVNEQSSFWRSIIGGKVSVAEMGDVLSKLNITTDDFSQAMAQARALGEGYEHQITSITGTTSYLAKQFGISADEAFKLGKKLTDLADNPSPDMISQLMNYLTSLNSTSLEGEKRLRAFTTELGEAGFTAVKASGYVDMLANSVDALNTITQQSNFESMKQGFEQEAIMLEKGAKAAKDYAIEHANLTDEQKKDLLAMNAENEALRENKKLKAATKSKGGSTAINQATNQLKQQEQALEIVRLKAEGMDKQAFILAATQRLGAKATSKQVEQAKAYADVMYDLTQAAPKFDSLKNQYGLESERLKAEYDQKIAFLDEYAIAHAAKHREIEATRNAIALEYQQQREEAQWQEFMKSSEGAAMLGGVIDSLNGTISNAFTGLLTGSKSAREALASISSTILNQVVSSFVEWGMASTRRAILDIANTKKATAAQVSGIATATSAQTAAIQTQTATSTVAAAQTTAAWTPAATVASIGSFGGAATIGLAAVMSALTMAASGRKNGGPVSAGSMYRVGENDQPEIFKANNGSQYMIPGNSGRVFSNKESQGGGRSGGGGSVTVVVNQTNHFGDKESRGDDRRLAITISEIIKAEVTHQIADQMRDGGMLSK